MGKKDVMTKAEIIDLINKHMPVEPIAPNYIGEVASRFRYLDGSGEIGVISSVSDAFCGSCNRASSFCERRAVYLLIRFKRI
nr:hypothetical protein P5625_07275 [Bacillus subtilis]